MAEPAPGGPQDGKDGAHAKPGGPDIGPKPQPDSQHPPAQPKHGK
jgi:hypothetical protein